MVALNQKFLSKPFIPRYNLTPINLNFFNLPVLDNNLLPLPFILCSSLAILKTYYKICIYKTSKLIVTLPSYNVCISHTKLPKQNFSSAVTNQFNTMEKKFVHFCKRYYNGLGYKIFVYQNKLFIWLGLTHYTILALPLSICIIVKKRRFYILGKKSLVFNNFLSYLKKIKKLDIYKGKGLLEIKNYKGFIKMKSGKKKQY